MDADIYESGYSLEFRQMWGEAIDLSGRCRHFERIIDRDTPDQDANVNRLKELLKEIDKLERLKDVLIRKDNEWVELTTILKGVKCDAESILASIS